MGRHTIHVENTDETYTCAEGLDLLRGMEALGRRGIPVGCRGGGCGICKVRVTRGEFTTRRMSRDHVCEADEAEGVVLACRCYPRSDIDLVAIEKLAHCIERNHPGNCGGAKATSPHAPHGATPPDT